MIDQILILATQQKLTLHGLDSLVSSLAVLDSVNVRKEARKLGQAGKLDTLVLFPDPVVVANQPPSFSGALDISRTLDTASQTVSNWITAISTGSSNEAGQKIRFEVVTDSGAGLFSSLPTVDSVGTLRYQAKSVGRGVFRVRAHDNGDSTGTNVNVSAWKSFAIQLFSRPVLIATGPSDTVRLVEDSASTISFTVQNFVGSSLSVKFAPVDTSLISAQIWKLIPDANGKVSISLQGRQDAFGGPVTTIVTLSDSVDNYMLAMPVMIAPRNDPTTFRIPTSKTVLISSAAARSLVGWIDSIAAGPANESGQKVSFELQVPAAQATQFAVLPWIDSVGAIHFTGKANSSGTVQVQVRAHDNGDSTGANVNTSAWASASLIFDVSPTITLSNRTVSTWEGHSTTDSATLWGNSGVASLVAGWTVSDTTLLPHDNLVFPGSGDLRVFQMRPVVGKWGSAKIVFTVMDSLGATAKDSLTLTVNPVNHAPILTLKSPTLLDTTWRGEQTFVLTTLSWDDAATQTGRVDLQLVNPSDSAYLSTLRVDGVGILHVLAKVDTSLNISFRIRAHDSAGTANGGMDTSAWSSSLTLGLVDTVKDTQGIGYRARTMPDGKVWMRSNLRTIASIGPLVWADSLHRSGLSYSWAQAMNLSDTNCDTVRCKVSGLQQGICPVGWHISDSAEWGKLVSAVGGTSGDSVGFQKLRADTGWAIYSNQMGIFFDTTRFLAKDEYRFGVYSAQSWSPFAGNHNTKTVFGAAFWTNDGVMTLQNSLAMYQTCLSGGCGSYQSGGASIRCVRN